VNDLELNHREVRRILEDKGITHLYHANSTQTACTFIANGGLLSRGAVEHYENYQTPQSSDLIDKQFNVWNDIFLDSIDLHTLFRRQNHYGPILFKYNLNLLDQGFQLPLWITKNNPIYWETGQLENERYIQDLNEFDTLYTHGSYRTMITFRNTHNYLPFIPFLEEIIIDDPELIWSSNKANLYEESEKAIKEAMDKSLHNYNSVSITRRECSNCYCKSNYKEQVTGEQMKLKFSVLNN